MRHLPALILVLSFASFATADVFHVNTQGVDDASRDGRTVQTAWASLAFACEQVPAGNHTIRLGAGTFTASRTATPAAGITIEGNGHEGPAATRIVAAKTWKLSAEPCKGEPVDEYLIALRRTKGVTIRNLVLASDPAHRITGAVYIRDGEGITLSHLHVHDFRWSGLRLEHSRNLDISHCLIENASTDKCQYHGGMIATKWLKHSRIHHNRIVSTIGKGYGYKGGGHEGVRIHHNQFDVAGEFAIESAHENEYGLEIDHNIINRCISVPKGGQGDDPNKRGYTYSVWIHHNHLTDSYTVEGPRNHLRISHNYIPIEKTGGRVYTHHGGRNNGPIWIHHNVVENLDRAFVWMNQGLAQNIHIYNNTVACADAGERTGTIIDCYAGDRLDNWVVKNNIFIAPADKPRKLMQTERGADKKYVVSGNVCINVSEVPAGNHTDDPMLTAQGEKPWPWYMPASAQSFVVDRGENVDLPFKGKAPDIGAGELGDVRELKVGPKVKDSLSIVWEKNILTIAGDHLPGPITINYLEAYCRPGSTDRDWHETVIGHKTELIEASEDKKTIKLRCTLKDGVIVDHVITAGAEDVDFRLTAKNPTDKESAAHWAQPCIRVDKFVGVPSKGSSEEYLPKSFIYVDGKLSRMPTQPWAKKARYIPGQVYAPKGVPRDDVNPRPLSDIVPSNGLIGCFSKDETMIFATAFEPYQELFQGVIVCLHSDFRIGGLKAGETKQIRGKVYLMKNDEKALLTRYAKDFPEHVK